MVKSFSFLSLFEVELPVVVLSCLLGGKGYNAKGIMENPVWKVCF